VSVTARRPRAKPQRRHERDPDADIPGREISSLSIISNCVRQVGIAASAADEKALRVELRRLAAESLILAKQDELLRTSLSARQRIAIERDRTPRSGTS
jgi:hypothetical protein